MINFPVGNPPILIGMNYGPKRFPTFEDLFRVVSEGVKPGWLEARDPRTGKVGPTNFCEQLKVALRFLYRMAEEEAGNYLPSPELLLEPFRWMRPDEVKVVITAQDPYPRAEDAAGIAFHSLGRRCPLSALRINQNLIHYQLINPRYEHVSDYRTWLAQGVLLTNVALTTKEGESRSHSTLWKGVVQCALQLVPRRSVALLLGRDAQSILSTLTSIHRIEHGHPVAREEEFNSKNIFGEVNERLASMKFPPINWTPGPARRP